MNLEAFEAITKAFATADVRYLVVGGVAVNAHGYIRLTMDIDLVIALDGANIERAFQALANVGYRPTVPIDVRSFSDAGQRTRWREEKGMQVLNFFSDAFPGTSVDLFVYEPFDFADEYAHAPNAEVWPGVIVRYVSMATLIRMKLAAGRPRDLDDVRHLRRLREDLHGD